MRKLLFILLIILLLIGAGLTIANGFELGDFEIWGIKGIISENEDIDIKNKELSNLVSVTYPNTLSELETGSKTLSSTREEYEEKAILVSNSKYYMQTEKYEIEFLWTKLGNYAKENNVQIKIDVVNSSTADLYDLKFTIAGEYVKVIDFIYDLENDSKLGFKVEDFHMSSVDGGVQGAFTCKEISINIDDVIEEGADTEELQGNEGILDDSTQSTDTTDTETTNTNTDSNTTQNTTNTTTTDNTTEEQTNTEAE